MIKFSAEDIANQTFQKSVRGYDSKQVEEFLAGVSREWGYLVDELHRLQREVETQAQELREYRRRERSLVEALEMAKQVADEIRHQAERDAELVLAETELKAEKILSQTEARACLAREELFNLQQHRVRLEKELRHVLQSHLELVDAIASKERVVEMPPVPQKEEARKSEFETIPVLDDSIVDERIAAPEECSASN